jgi:outer membrane protein assembly factor BamE (lipoprotein component of BamABCDE complex)
MKKLSLYVLILSTLVCHGCGTLPPINYSTSPAENIDSSFLKVGVTTKEDVVLAFGYPYKVGPDERWLIYVSGFRKGVVVELALFIPIPVGTKGTLEFLHIHFDENDIVSDYEFRSPAW